MIAFSSVFSATRLPRRLAVVGVTLASSLLTACYVVPVNRNPPPTVVYVTPAAQAPTSATLRPVCTQPMTLPRRMA